MNNPSTDGCSTWTWSTCESKWQHVFVQLQYFISSEVKPKWLQWTELTPPWSPSAWPFAKRWPARARPSTSPLPLAQPFPSPWTPGARSLKVLWPRRGQAPRRKGGMPSARRNFSTRSSRVFQLGFHLKMSLSPCKL